MKDVIDSINKLVCEKNYVDFEVISYSNNQITIHASEDFAYGHFLELHFIEVIAFQISKECTIDIPKGLFEIGDIYKIGEHEYYPVFWGGRSYWITAKNLNYSAGMVYYYNRENLQDGERLAPWVK